MEDEWKHLRIVYELGSDHHASYQEPVDIKWSEAAPGSFKEPVDVDVRYDETGRAAAWVLAYALEVLPNAHGRRPWPVEDGYSFFSLWRLA